MDSGLTQTLDLIRELAGKIGQTVEALWPHSVRFHAIQALTGCTLAAIVIIFCVLTAFSIYRKKDILDSEIGGTIFMACIGGAFLGVVIFSVSLPKVLEPTGSLVIEIIRDR